MQARLIAGVALALMLAAGSTSALAAKAIVKTISPPPPPAAYTHKKMPGRMKSGTITLTRNMPAPKSLKGKTAQDNWNSATGKRVPAPATSAPKTGG